MSNEMTGSNCKRRGGNSAILFQACVLLAVGGCAIGPADGDSNEQVGTTSSALSTRCGTRFVDVGGSSSATAECRSNRSACSSIQHAIDVACPGDQIHIDAGDYVENLLINKSVWLRGKGRRTVIRPAQSSPAPCTTNDRTCGGTASTLAFVTASGVTIQDLTLNGDNPALASGVVRNGADLDARNGIITDEGAGERNDLVVRGVTVKNIYHRAIFTGGGGTFRFEDNVVDNVAGDRWSIAIFNRFGSGAVLDNTVSRANDGIGSNFSHGIVFRGNKIRQSGSGVHTDNPSETGSTVDVIEDNDISECAVNGYGIFTFVPFVPPVIRNNQIRGCTVGLAIFGQGRPGTTTFEDNFVDAEGAPNSVGVLVTTDQLGFGAADVAATIQGNTITRHTGGIQVVTTDGRNANVTATCNAIVDNQYGVISAATPLTVLHDNLISKNEAGVIGPSSSSSPLDATGNYWGCSAGPGSAGCDTVVGNVDSSSQRSRAPRCVSNDDGHGHDGHGHHDGHHGRDNDHRCGRN